MEKKLSLIKQIPAGYKQTEIGVIPEDWDVKKLGDIGDSIIGLTYSPSDVSYFGKLVHRSSNIQNNQLSYNDNVYVDKHINEKLILKENDILICVRNGSRNLIGKSALIKGKSVGETFGAFMSVFRSDKFQPFIFYLILSNLIQRQINQSLGATINQITNKTLNNFQIPFPPKLKEQTAIATVLSDADALIEHLEKLIAKKKAIKQGTMQQLLTSKKRLMGFNGEWEVKKLGEVGNCIRGVSYNGERDLSPYDTNTTVRLLRSNNIQDGTIDLSELQFVNISRVKPIQALQKNDIVICMANGSKRLVGKSAIFGIANNYNYTFGAFMGCFRTNPNQAVSRFISFTFQTYQYRSYIDVLLSGSSINNLKPSDIESIEILFPKQKEQIAIANIFSDMDTEIESLEQKRDKYIMLKQGMMQQLLTGRIRIYANN